jgi:hypothetical protein
LAAFRRVDQGRALLEIACIQKALTGIGTKSLSVM